MVLEKGKKVYFISDLHLGVPDLKSSQDREKKFLRWIDFVKKDAQKIYILGDLFDFWFEYKTVIPKGFVRTLGKLTELTDNGIEVDFFVGNHDLWMKDYFQKELNIPVYHKPQKLQINQKKFIIGHGDGLGPGDKGFKLMKKLFKNKVAQFLFRWFHPDLGVALGQRLSVNNKMLSGQETPFLGEEEWLIQYAKEELTKSHIDYFIFGHRHLPIVHKLNEKSTYFNLGQWITQFHYSVYDGENTSLLDFKEG